MPSLEPKFCSLEDLFACFQRTPADPYPFILDVRDKKHFLKGHVPLSYCVRVTSNGAALLDYSANEYAQPWSAACYAGKPVFVYGPAGLKKDHPVVAFLLKEGVASSVSLLRNSFEDWERRYPFLVTPSIKQNCAKFYPSEILPGRLYLGDFEQAASYDRLKDIGVRRIVTIHNHPENLQPPPGIKHLKITMADLETEQIHPHFEAAYSFIEEGAQKKEACLVHCGAGVSRSACLVIAYLMRRNKINADRANDFVRQRRSIVAVNDGFWAQLCAYEALLGITERSDPRIPHGGHGMDWEGQEGVAAIDKKNLASVIVAASSSLLNALDSKPVIAKVEGAVRSAAAGVAAPPPPPALVGGTSEPERRNERERERGERDRRRSRSRSRSRSRDRRRSRSRDRRDRREHRRSRSRSREGDRDRGRSRRSRSRDRGSRWDRSRSRDRDRREGGRDPRDSRDRERERAAPPPPAPSRAAEGVAEAAALLASLPPQVHAQSRRFTIEVVKEGAVIGTVKVAALAPGQRVVFGRLETCEVVLEHASSSRQHAQLHVDLSGNLVLADLGSAHGTSVDGAWLKSKGSKEVGEGSQLRFGASSRVYVIRGLERVL